MNETLFTPSPSLLNIQLNSTTHIECYNKDNSYMV